MSLRPAPAFEPPPATRGLVEWLAQQLGARIVQRDFSPGQPLPTEGEIQAAYSVSRTVVREATRLLAAKGLVSVRPKTGVRIRPASDWNMIDPDVMRWHLDGPPDLAFILSLYEIREIFEPQAARLAAERITPEDGERLSRAMAGIATHARGSPELIESDLAFHRLILVSTANPVLRSLGALIEQTMAVSFALSWRQTPQDESVEQHRRVCEAILAGDGEDAAYAMRRLIRSARQDVLAEMRVSPVDA